MSGVERPEADRLEALVRPHLEYGESVSFPYKIKDIELTEKVQKRAMKQVKQIHRLCYSEGLKKIKLANSSIQTSSRGDFDMIFIIILHKFRDNDVTLLLMDCCISHVIPLQEDIH